MSNEFTPLTPEEDQQWNTFACGSRCLIRLAWALNRPISREAYVARFREYFPPGMLGQIDTSEIVAISKELGLARKLVSLRHRQAVASRIRNQEARGLLMMTDRDQDFSGAWADYFHVRLFGGFAPDGRWQFFHPNADGADLTAVFDEAEMEARLAHFLLLF